MNRTELIAAKLRDLYDGAGAEGADEIERLSAKLTPIGYVVLKYVGGDIVGGGEFVLERDRAESLAKRFMGHALRRGMGTTYGVGVVVAPDPTEPDDE